MVSLNFFKLFKRKKVPKDTSVDSKSNGTKPSADIITNVGKANKLSKKEKPAKLQVEEPNGLKQVNLKEKEEASRPLGEQVSGQLNKQHEEVDVADPVGVEQQTHSKVVEDKPALNEVNVPDGTSVTEEIREARSTPVFQANLESAVINGGANESLDVSKETKKVTPVEIDQSNAPEDTGIIEQEALNKNLESKGESTEHVEIPDKADEGKFETGGFIQRLEPIENIGFSAEANKVKVETDKSFEPVERTEHDEIPTEIKEGKVEVDRLLEPIEVTKSTEIPVETDKVIESIKANEHVDIPAETEEIKNETDKVLEAAQTTENIESPTEAKEDNVETNKPLEPVDPTDLLFEEFLKNAENNVFPNAQSKEIFKSYKDRKIDEAAAIILLKEAEGKAKSKIGNTNNKKSKKNSNKKKGKKGKKK